MKYGVHISLALITISATPSIILYAATVTDVIRNLRVSIGYFVVIGVGAALAAFIMGMIAFLASSGNEQAHETGRQRMVWGIVGLFFVVSIWGIVNLLQVTFIGPTSRAGCTPTMIDMSLKRMTECL